jgi:quinol-cytochrome oxidoreductase complex cytochrome b subunit
MDMQEDGEERRFRMMPLGDIGTLAIALLFLVLFVLLMFFPSVFTQFLMPPNATPQAQPAGEVSVTLPEKPKN